MNALFTFPSVPNDASNAGGVIGCTFKTNTMRYLVSMPNEEPFFTNIFQPEDHFCTGMIVYDLVKLEYYDHAGKWKAIAVDHL
jgi:hypothetical protein